MRAFGRLTAIAAPLPLANVDTDKILAGRFLKTISREGLGGALFSAIRYDERGNELADFILNRMPWRNAGILVSGPNFGCGSSREHAPWALADFGIRSIIAPSFADIFHDNCLKNGILPIKLESKSVDLLMADAGAPDSALLTVDLKTQTILRVSGDTVNFSIASGPKRALLLGLDEIEGTLQQLAVIERWEKTHPKKYQKITQDLVEKPS